MTELEHLKLILSRPVLFHLDLVIGLGHVLVVMVISQLVWNILGGKSIQ